MNLDWKTPDRQGRVVYASGGIALVALALLPFATTRSIGIGLLAGALIATTSAFLFDQFSSRDD